MPDVGTVVRSLPALSSTAQPASLSPAGAQIVIPWQEGLVQNGYVFGTTGTLSRTDGETGEVGAGNMDIDPLEPSFMFDVPDGFTVIPLAVTISIEDMAGVNNIIAIMAEMGGTRYSSGGVSASTVRNYNGANPRSSVVTNVLSGDTAITASAAVNEIILWSWTDPFVDEAGGHAGVLLWNPNVTPAPYIKGPGSFLVYVHSDTPAAEFTITAAWAEIPDAQVGND